MRKKKLAEPAVRIGDVMAWRPDMLDGRTRLVRRHNEIAGAVAADLGGLEQLTEARAQLVARFASLCLWTEIQEAALLAGDESFDADTFSRVSGHLRRLAETVGLDRVSKDITPSLSEYLRRASQPVAGELADVPGTQTPAEAE